MNSRSLGAIVPTFGDWQFFTNAALNSQTFKFVFSGVTLPIRSYLLIQSVFSTGEVSPAIRVYPSSQEVYRDIQLPQALQDDNETFRFLACKKVWKNRRFVGSQFEPNWSVSAFEISSDNPSSPPTQEQLTAIEAGILAMEVKLNQIIGELTQ